MTKLANSCYSDRAAYNRHVRYNSSISCIRHRDAANVVRPIFVWKKAFTVRPPLSFFGFHDGGFFFQNALHRVGFRVFVAFLFPLPRRHICWW